MERFTCTVFAVFGILWVMESTTSKNLKDGAKCKVIGGTHTGKWGTVQDIHKSKTGHITITVLQEDGERFKTLAKNVELV